MGGKGQEFRIILLVGVAAAILSPRTFVGVAKQIRSRDVVISAQFGTALLLKEVRLKAKTGRGSKQWQQVADFLERVFSRRQLINVEEVKKVDNKLVTLSLDMMSF